MNVSRDSYWSIDACAWVESPEPAEVPAQRYAEQPSDVVDLAEVEQQYAVPV